MTFLLFSTLYSVIFYTAGICCLYSKVIYLFSIYLDTETSGSLEISMFTFFSWKITLVFGSTGCQNDVIAIHQYRFRIDIMRKNMLYMGALIFCQEL